MKTETRRCVPPLGWPPHFRMVVARAGERPGLVTLNRYPRQLIGLGLRLPKFDYDDGYPYLSILWARPAPWWV